MTGKFNKTEYMKNYMRQRRAKEKESHNMESQKTSMMSDIVYILRHPPFGCETSERNIMDRAAGEIENLRGRIGLLLDIIDNYDIGADLDEDDGDVLETIREQHP